MGVLQYLCYNPFMLSEPTIDRNIVVLFDKKLTNQFIKLSENISSVIHSKINLNLNDEIPHLTLYMTKYPAKNNNKVLEKLKEISSHIKPFKIFFNSKSLHSTGTVFIDTLFNNNLYMLHSNLVDTLNPLREGLYNKDELNLPSLTNEKKQSLINYGMWAVKKNYTPHVSVGRIDIKESVKKVLDLLPNVINYKTIINKIAYVERGHDGTCKKILKTFKLSGGSK